MKKITKNEKFGKLENGISSVTGHSSVKYPIVRFSWNDDTTFILSQKLWSYKYQNDWKLIFHTQITPKLKL